MISPTVSSMRSPASSSPRLRVPTLAIAATLLCAGCGGRQRKPRTIAIVPVDVLGLPGDYAATMDDALVTEAKKDKRNQLSIMILMRLEAVDDEPPTLGLVKALSMRDRNFVRDFQEEVEGGVDTTVEMECPFCRHEFDRQLDVNQPGFFSPSAVLKRSKKRSSI